MIRTQRSASILLAAIVALALTAAGVLAAVRHFVPSASPAHAQTGGVRLDLVSGPAAQLGISGVHANASTDALIRRYQTSVRQSPTSGNYVNLALAYMQKERETTDVTYYTLTNQALDAALRIDPKNYPALTYKAWVYLGRHDFVHAAALAQQAIDLNPYDPTGYANLGDAESNLGNYGAMDKAYQKLVNVKPSLVSYNRASYVRWLYGDVRGAFDLMRLAIRAGSTQPENLAWVESQLADDYMSAGFVTAAESEYKVALHTFPHYARALFGLGNVAVAEGNLRAAAHDYQQAIAIVPLPQYVIALGDLYTLAGQPRDAAREYALVRFINRVFEVNHVQFGIELAQFYADHNIHIGDALRIAQATVTVRHDVLTEDTLAWALYRSGRYAAAWHAEKQALRLGTKDGLLYFHAGMILTGLGHLEAAQGYLSNALMTNPHFSILGPAVARATLASLSGHRVSHRAVH
jgi:tetratricopeptide (TPR) repeat protein